MMAVDKKLPKEPIVTFGVLADVQYADCDDRPPPCDAAGKTRFYRSALHHVDKAFDHWKAPASKAKFVLQLGDIIDGLNRTHGGSHSGLARTLSHFEKHASIPTFHTVGNHELYNFDRKELAALFYNSIKKLDIPPEMFCPTKPSEENPSISTPVLYYKFSPVNSVKCISLDCFDVSVLGYDEANLNYQEAAKVLTSRHGHSVFEDWDSNGSLLGLDVRFQQMNGALGKEQMMWLDAELKESDELGQKVIVYGNILITYFLFIIKQK